MLDLKENQERFGSTREQLTMIVKVRSGQGQNTVGTVEPIPFQSNSDISRG